jgi:hypothetical protein
LTSQLFESASLEEALAEVRDTVGPHAKIVRAEKVRRGGIAGFFTKESFVLSVERDGTETPEGGNGDFVRTIPAAQQVSWTQPAADAYADPFRSAVDTPAVYTLDALADFADRSDDSVDSATHAALNPTPVSTETPLFGQVLREVSRGTAADDELPAGPRWDGRMVDLDEHYRSVMPLVSAPTAPQAPPLVYSMPKRAARPEPAREIPLVPYPEAPAQQPWWQTLADVAETQAAGPQVPDAPVSIDLVSDRPAPTQPVPTPPAAPVDERLGGELFEPEARPEPPVAPAPRTSPATADLAAGLATIDAALGPALLPGSVIAVVGHPGDACTVAARVAVAASADPFSIHIASPDPAARAASGLPTGRQVGSVDEAILRSRRWPSRPTPVVVVVDGRDSRWARVVLDAIEATTVLALPSPDDDDDDVRRWVAELGGVQALLVDDSCASTPQALTLHGIPAMRSPWSLETIARRAATESGER